MESPRTTQPSLGRAMRQTMIQPQSDVQTRRPLSSPAREPEPGPGYAGYGLPCANCRTYYSADLTVCPVCRSTQRVSAAAVPVRPAPALNEPTADGRALEEERERFLREFKSQVYASHMQINAAASFRCSLEENHQGTYEPAAVCQCCYNRAQEHADLMEAALHIDLKEAAQIVYDAVWSDPSDSSKTYQNAALALLTELRKRAGINLVLGRLQPLPH
jgi:hypothetical protein